jgi:hypothetical protein
MADGKSTKKEPRLEFIDNFPITEKEKNLLEYSRDLDWGDFHVFVQEREPVRVEKAKASKKL